MAEILVRAQAISRSFGVGDAAVTALASASVQVHDGDRVALVGPSGSGKSTLLQLLAGLDEPSTGSIEWPGLGGLNQLRPGPVSMCFQGPSLLPPLSVEENVALPLLLAGLSESEALRCAREAIDWVDLGAVATHLPEQISGGQAQRAGIARALVGAPRLILADEPTGQQDREGGRRVMDAIVDRADDVGAALIVATHDHEIADRMTSTWNLRDRTVAVEVVLR
jgi:ABC-type lipoprotein export system ATPase subunit